MGAATKYSSILYDDAAASLPLQRYSKSKRTPPENQRILAVFDDDPTGTQTVHDVTVLTTFETEIFREQLESGEPGFFILTNTRAYPTQKAKTILQNALNNLRTASDSTGKLVDIVLRSDSTLRGYFPLENSLAESIFGPYDAWVLAPSFFEGGRVTVQGVHYALDAHDQKTLVPVGDTPSAQDKSFGFRSSHMREWVYEKLNAEADGSVRPQVTIIGAEVLRHEDAPLMVADILRDAKNGSRGDVPPIIVPSTFDFDDMSAFVAGCERVPDTRLLYRTGASFVSSKLGIERIPPVSPSALFGSVHSKTEKAAGGLVVIGSYIPRTTAQREYLLSHCQQHIQHFELDVEVLLNAKDDNEELIKTTAADIDEVLAEGTDAVVSTSRKLISSDNAEESLRMGSIVNNVLVTITKAVTVRPKYVIAKGGITSSDVATESLGIKKAKVVGQAASGVPLWRSEPVGSPKWLDVPFVVFPGNVGTSQTLGDLVSSYRQV